MDERGMIWEEDIEKSVVGTLFSNSNSIHLLMLEPKHLKDERLKTILWAVQCTFHKHNTVNEKIVYKYLKETDKLNTAGGVEFLSQVITDWCPTPVFEAYQSKIVDSYLRENAKRVFVETTEKLSKGDDYTTSIAEMVNRLHEETNTDEMKFSSFDEMSYRFLKEQSKETKREGLSSGIETLDRQLGFFEKGELTVVGARPSMGKSCFLLNIAANMCFNGKRVLFFSLEDTENVVMSRIYSRFSGVKARRIRVGNIDNEEISELLNANVHISKFMAKNFLLVDRYKTIQQIASMCAIEKAKNGADVIFIDHLHKLTGGSEENKDVAIAVDKITKIANETNIPVILAAQLNRGVEKRENKRPMKSDLRGSGVIEQNARCIMFLYRDSYYNREDGDNKLLEVIVDKATSGETGSIPLRIELDNMLVSDWDFNIHGNPGCI